MNESVKMPRGDEPAPKFASQKMPKRDEPKPKGVGPKVKGLPAGDEPLKVEMGVGGISGFQLPLGVKNRKDEIKECLNEAQDVNEAHVFVAASSMTAGQLLEFYDAIDFKQYEQAASMIREHVVRQAVRQKLREVVRKKAGGGGYTLYAPNRGKKHGAKPVATFPTRLAAKRAELARFPPKDPKKLVRLRKEIEKMLKDPKKRAEAERRAMKTRGTDVGKHHKAGRARGHHFENKIIAKILSNGVRARVMNEGLFKEDAPGSDYDEFVSKISDRSLKGDKGFQRVMAKFNQEVQNTLSKSLKIVQKEIGANARVKPLGVKKHEDGRQYVAFKLETEDASVGPIYIYAENGVPRIELSDEAKGAISKVQPATARSIRAALSATGDALENTGGLRDMIGQRDAYLAKMDGDLDKMITGLSPVQFARVKQLIVQKYRGHGK